MIVPIGATSYVFRYLLGNPLGSLGIEELIRYAKTAGLDAFQICENARPLSTSIAEWSKISRLAADLNLRLSLGCMTLDPEEVKDYLNRVQAIGGKYLRIVLERQGETTLTLKQIRQFLDQIVPELKSRDIHLAIENHFEIPSSVLAEAVEAYSPKLVGFCVDIANSLRNFEDTETVLKLLSSRAVCYHLKDYVVTGSNVGFAVSGVPFGEGRIGAAALLRRLIFDHGFAPEMFIETWTPASGIWAHDIREDARLLQSSIRNLTELLSQIHAEPNVSGGVKMDQDPLRIYGPPSDCREKT